VRFRSFRGRLVIVFVGLGAGEPAQVAFVVSLKTEWRIPRRIDPYKGSPGN